MLREKRKEEGKRESFFFFKYLFMNPQIFLFWMKVFVPYCYIGLYFNMISPERTSGANVTKNHNFSRTRFIELCLCEYCSILDVK